MSELVSIEVVQENATMCAVGDEALAMRQFYNVWRDPRGPSIAGRDVDPHDLRGVGAALFHRTSQVANDAVRALRESGIALGLVAYEDMEPPPFKFVEFSARLQPSVLSETLSHGASVRSAQLANDIAIDYVRLRASPHTIMAYLDYAISVYERIAINARRRTFQPHLSMSLTNRALLLVDLGGISEAERQIEQAIRMRIELARERPAVYTRQLIETAIAAQRIAGLAGRSADQHRISAGAAALIVRQRSQNPRYYSRLWLRLRPSIQVIEDADALFARPVADAYSSILESACVSQRRSPS